MIATHHVPRPRIVTASTSGKTVSLARGQVLSIRLAENPSTGYTWKVSGAPNRSIARSLGSYYRQGPCAAGAVGCGGTEYFRYRDSGAGTTRVTIHLYPPGQSVASNAFTLRIVGH